MFRLISLFFLIVSMVCPGLVLGQSSVAKPSTGPAVSAADRSATMRDYRIVPLDVLSISVFQEPDLTRDVKVSQTGSITFPLLGKVEVSGLLVSEVESRIAGLLGRDFIKHPQVSVSVKEFAARRVSVLGEVHKPGSFEIPAEERMSLLQAIAKAEGFTNLAKTDAVVIRRVRDGKEDRIKVNATDLMEDTTDKKDVNLEPGDIVVVPTRFF